MFNLIFFFFNDCGSKICLRKWLWREIVIVFLLFFWLKTILTIYQSIGFSELRNFQISAKYFFSLLDICRCLFLYYYMCLAFYNAEYNREQKNIFCKRYIISLFRISLNKLVVFWFPIGIIPNQLEFPFLLRLCQENGSNTHCIKFSEVIYNCLLYSHDANCTNSRSLDLWVSRLEMEILFLWWLL